MADWSAKVCMRLTTVCGELAGLASAQDERAERPFRPKQWDNKRCAKPCFKHSVTQVLSGTLAKVGNLQGLSLGYRLAETSFPRRDVQLAKPCDDLLVEPRGLAELEPIDLRAIVEHRTGIGA